MRSAVSVVACAVSALLLCSAVPGFSADHPGVHRARHVAAPHSSTEISGPVGPSTVYGGAGNEQDIASGGPVVVLAGYMQPAVAGLAETVYGDASRGHVYEIASADTSRPAPAALPLTVYEGGDGMAAAGLPETVYAGGDWHPGRVNEAVTAANAITGEGVAEEQNPAEENSANESGGEEVASTWRTPGYYLPLENGLPLFRNGAGLPEETASPYSPYTDAQRAGMNPCEDKAPGSSPYGPLTDAQRAGQTNCR